VSAARAAEALARAGLNVTGALAIASYDALVPDAWRSAALAPGACGALVVGNGGRALWDAFARSPERALAENPLDAYTRRVLAQAARECAPTAAVGFYADKRDGAYLPLVALAQRAGFGTPGRIGVLVRPFQPRLAIRGVGCRGRPARRSHRAVRALRQLPRRRERLSRRAVVGLEGPTPRAATRQAHGPGCALACDARSARCGRATARLFARAARAPHADSRALTQARNTGCRRASVPNSAALLGIGRGARTPSESNQGCPHHARAAS
jgi:hypothetical protein